MKQALPIIVQLVHIHGPMKGRIQEFGANEISIGRHSSCDLQFPKDLVVISRNHARILREGNRFKIVDSSTNGTFVNGARITEAWLKNGDVIFFTEGGPKISFLTREGEMLPPPEPVPPVPPPPQADPGRFDPPQMPGQPSHPLFPPQPAGHQEPVIPAPPNPPGTSSSPGLVPSPPLPSSPPPQPPVEAVKAPLVIQYGAVLKSFHELPVTIGSQPDCDFVLEHPSLSGPQVQIYFGQGRYWVKDLTGRNPMRINDGPATSPCPLMPGDRLLLTPDGPGFQFLEGGRMAEIHLPRQEEAAPGKSVHDGTEPREKEKSPSLFKKIFG